MQPSQQHENSWTLFSRLVWRSRFRATFPTPRRW